MAAWSAAVVMFGYSALVFGPPIRRRTEHAFAPVRAQEDVQIRGHVRRRLRLAGLVGHGVTGAARCRRRELVPHGIHHRVDAGRSRNRLAALVTPLPGQPSRGVVVDLVVKTGHAGTGRGRRRRRGFRCLVDDPG
uniref:(northern house mosquito) hypothetical protein n=1 Tax=Culex pipiens TaxID=7175 RepID=A0A8D8J059_CULPI